MTTRTSDSGGEVELRDIDRLWALASRGVDEKVAQPDEFLHFRQRIRMELTGAPLLVNKWVEQVCMHLTDFYNDLIAGKRPRIALFTPPQHGKSILIRDFIAWASGRAPRLRTIFASYSQDMGQTANDELRRIMMLEKYKESFHWMHIGAPGWRCTSELIEYPAHRGLFYNTTVRGPITGRGFELGVIDDPHKGVAEARSATERNHVWDWFIGDFMSRQDAKAGLICIMTRWHVDDLMGRYLDRERGDNKIKVLRYPAIAERDELYRRTGDALFPQHKPLEFLKSQQNLYSDGLWQAMYQQHPIIVGGGVIPIEKFRAVPYWNRERIKASVRYWDKAGTAGGGAYTAGVLMHAMEDGTFVISNIVRGQWSFLEREQRIKTETETDSKFYKNYQVVIEREPGSSGKDIAEYTIRNLAGFRVKEDRVDKHKETRAEPFIAQCQGGNVWYVADNWIYPFLEECEGWPNSTTKDQVDAAAGAFTALVGGPAMDTSYAAFQPGFIDYDLRR